MRPRRAGKPSNRNAGEPLKRHAGEYIHPAADRDHHGSCPPPATPTRIATATSLAVVVPESLKNTDLSFEVPQNVEQVKNWTGDLYKLGLKTGMRQGEMFGLTWKNADLERAEIHIRRNFPASEKATSRFVSPHSKPGTAAAPSPSGRIWLRC
ncbi:hypothetical protein GW781_13430 [bacterium]|nr:hypothetical protein [bacterium]